MRSRFYLPGPDLVASSTEQDSKKHLPASTIRLEKSTIANKYYRRVAFTAHGMQLVLMMLLPNQDIHWERHPVDQFFRVEQGDMSIYIGYYFTRKGSKTKLWRTRRYRLRSGDALIIPRNMMHRVVNDSAKQPLSLYTIYAPPQHPPGTKQFTRPVDD